MELFFYHAAGADTCHAADTFQTAHEGVFHECGELNDVHAFHRDCGHGHRQHGGVDFQNIGGRYGFGPAALQCGDLLLDVYADSIQIGAFFKLQGHQRIVVGGVGGDVYNALQRCHTLLDGACDFRLYLFGAGTGVRGHNDDVGEVHVGQQVGGHTGIGDDAKDQNGDGNDEYGKWFFDTEFRHWGSSLHSRWSQNDQCIIMVSLYHIGYVLDDKHFVNNREQIDTKLGKNTTL